MRDTNRRCLAAVFICILTLFVTRSQLCANEESHYAVARQCVEWALPGEDFFAFFDALMADSIKEQVADNVRFRGYEKTIAEIYQQGTRDFLVQDRALESTWDAAARKLMSEFSESELLSLRDYQTRKAGKEFLETATGRKWREKAETVVRAAFEDVRNRVFQGSRYESYRKTIEENIALYEAQGKLPARLVRSDASPVELIPADSQAPLFQVFEALPKKPDKTTFTIDSTKPLLVISSLSELVLARDGKGVLVRLNEKDAKAFAELTRKFRGKVLFLQCTDTLLEGVLSVRLHESQP
jgi:hypothetical protein